MVICIPTGPFKILDEMGELYVVQERRAADFVAPKL